MNWTNEARIYVWNRATSVPGWDSREYRKDRCGAIIRWEDYGRRDRSYGWEIDHIIPLSRGGTDTLGNIEALQWENNVSKGGKEEWYCKVTSVEGIHNSSNVYISIDKA